MPRSLWVASLLHESADHIASLISGRRESGRSGVDIRRATLLEMDRHVSTNTTVVEEGRTSLAPRSASSDLEIVPPQVEQDLPVPLEVGRDQTAHSTTVRNEVRGAQFECSSLSIGRLL